MSSRRSSPSVPAAQNRVQQNRAPQRAVETRPAPSRKVPPRTAPVSPAVKARRRARTRRRQAIVLCGVLLLSLLVGAGVSIKRYFSNRHIKAQVASLAALPLSLDPKIAAAEKVAKIQVCDVAVVGGTPSGVAAALAAARAGAQVVLVEPRPLLGGDMTYAWINQFDVPVKGLHSNHSPIDYGIFGEFYRELGIAFSPERARVLIETKLAAEPNIQVLRGTPIEHISLDEGRIRAALLRTSSKRWTRLVANAWIDATNDADIAAKAGSGFFLGREQANPDRAMQATGLFFKLKNINWGRIRSYTHQQRALPLREAIKEKPTILASADARLRGKNIVLTLGGGTGPYAWERGDIVKSYKPRMDDTEVMSINFGRTGEDEAILNTLNILGVNGLNARSREHGRNQAIRELKYLVPFLRRRMPGLRKAELAGVAPDLYVRETRHIAGLSQLTAEDVKSAKLFPDRIALCAYSMDLHPYKRNETPSGTRRWVFTLPLKTLIPARGDGLFVASRSLSATWMAAGAARVIPVTMAAGQAAGVCAAMCAQQDLTPREFASDTAKIVELQEALRQNGVDIGDKALILARESRRTTG